MKRIVEQEIEDACIEWLEDLGYEYQPGPEISPDGEKPERKDWKDVVLVERLRNALKKINNVPDDAIDEAIKKIIYPSTQNLQENN